jgi:hypothetical protein
MRSGQKPYKVRREANLGGILMLDGKKTPIFDRFSSVERGSSG